MDKNGQIHGYYRPYTDRFGRKDKGIKWGILKEENKQMKIQDRLYQINKVSVPRLVPLDPQTGLGTF